MSWKCRGEWRELTKSKQKNPREETHSSGWLEHGPRFKFYHASLRLCGPEMGSIMVDSETSFSIPSAFLLKVSSTDVEAVGSNDRWVLILIELAFW